MRLQAVFERLYDLYFTGFKYSTILIDLTVYFTDSSMAEQFSVRLVDENGNLDTNHGNVQVMHLGLWGSVFDTYWQFSDANVVCRQLNYAYALRATRCAVDSIVVLGYS